MTLTDFLLARIAEDEELAHAATPGAWKRDGGWTIIASPPEDWSGLYVVVETRHRNDAEFVARQDPARVLAECEAKRRIVELHANSGVGSCYICAEAARDLVECVEQRILAAVYADHPDYRAEWKP